VTGDDQGDKLPKRPRANETKRAKDFLQNQVENHLGRGGTSSGGGVEKTGLDERERGGHPKRPKQWRELRGVGCKDWRKMVGKKIVGTLIQATFERNTRGKRGCKTFLGIPRLKSTGPTQGDRGKKRSEEGEGGTDSGSKLEVFKRTRGMMKAKLDREEASAGKRVRKQKGWEGEEKNKVAKRS